MSTSPVVHRAQRFQDLLAIPGGDGPYVFTRMFRESDRGERRQSQRHLKLLKRVDGVIREIVRPGEKVVYLTEGRGFSFWERWVLGWRRAIVVTNSRAIFLQLDARHRPRLLHQQLVYGAITRVGDGRRGGVEVATRSGDTLELRGFGRADRAVLTAGLQNGVKANRAESAAAAVENLCPHCYEGLRVRTASCPNCFRTFRRGWLSALSSLAIPGLGDYRMGYQGIAVLELLIGVAVWAAYLFGPQAWGISGVRGTLPPLWVFMAVHGADAVLTWHVARRGVFLSGMD